MGFTPPDVYRKMVGLAFKAGETNPSYLPTFISRMVSVATLGFFYREKRDEAQSSEVFAKNMSSFLAEAKSVDWRDSDFEMDARVFSCLPALCSIDGAEEAVMGLAESLGGPVFVLDTEAIPVDSYKVGFPFAECSPGEFMQAGLDGVPFGLVDFALAWGAPKQAQRFFDMGCDFDEGRFAKALTGMRSLGRAHVEEAAKQAQAEMEDFVISRATGEAVGLSGLSVPKVAAL